MENSSGRGFGRELRAGGEDNCQGNEIGGGSAIGV